MSGWCKGELEVGLVYRELYLGNPAMLAEYSLGTQQIVDRIDVEVADLRSLARDLDCTRGRTPRLCATRLRCRRGKGWSSSMLTATT